MKGTVKISEFVEFLTDNDMVIAPVNTVMRVDKMALKSVLMKKPVLSYAEIYEAEIWGRITRKRVYQIAKKYAREGEIISADKSEVYNDPEKIVISAVKRIAKMRNTHE